MEASSRSLSVAIVCPTLGLVSRGYESFAAGLFGALSRRPKVEVVLFQGGATADDSNRILRVRYLRPESRATRLIARAMRVSPISVSRIHFALGVLIRLRRRRVDVLIGSEREVCQTARRLQWVLGLRFAVVLNVGARHRPPYKHVDLVKHSSPLTLRWALEFGEDPARHTLLEEGLDLSADLRPSRIDARRALGLPESSRVAISVGVLDLDEVKRHGAIAVALAESTCDYTGVFVGAPHRQTELLRKRLEELLPGRHLLGTVKAPQMPSVYAAADVLVSASRVEGFGRAIAEAVSLGLRVIVHDDEVMRWVAGEDAVFVDTDDHHALVRALDEECDSSDCHVAPTDRYSWRELTEVYENMLRQAAAARVSG